MASSEIHDLYDSILILDFGSQVCSLSAFLCNLD